ncbi:MAG: hypothetical protein IIB44_05050 [Candidatus Marinimicrobia bacterium]|nr:hypothetical protein [Candidatus Neomarinimicrobiota bacterium]
MKQQYSFRLTALPFLIFLLFLLTPNTSAQQVQDKIYAAEETTISGGAEFNIMLQEAIRSGNIDNFIYSGNFTPPITNSPNTITTFDGFDFEFGVFFVSGFVAGFDVAVNEIDAFDASFLKKGIQRRRQRASRRHPSPQRGRLLPSIPK